MKILLDKDLGLKRTNNYCKFLIDSNSCNKSGANYTIIRKLDEKNQFLIIYG